MRSFRPQMQWTNYFHISAAGLRTTPFMSTFKVRAWSWGDSQHYLCQLHILQLRSTNRMLPTLYDFLVQTIYSPNQFHLRSTKNLSLLNSNCRTTPIFRVLWNRRGGSRLFVL